MKRLRTLPGSAAAIVCAFALAFAAQARPAFFLPERLYAVAGVEMNVYWYDVFDALVPDAYVLTADSEVGKCLTECWRWTPTAADQGTERRLVLKAWNDDGVFAAATTTVSVAYAPHGTERTITVAQLAASSANCLYQDQVFRRMRAAGWKNYRPVGTHSGGYANCRDGCRVMPDWEKTGKFVPHDGFGGFTFGSFLRRWQLTPDEFTELQSKGESDQMKQFGISVINNPEVWRRHLLKSPLLRLKDGAPVLDVRNWLDRINGGRAPDVIIIDLGGNGNYAQTDETIESYVRDVQLKDADELIGALRAVCPHALIGLATRCMGSSDQSAYSITGGSRYPRCQVRKNYFFWNRRLSDYVAAKGDPRLVLIPISQCIDPVHGYPREASKAHEHSSETVLRGTNASHPSPEGGRQIGDACYAWLRARLDRAAGLAPRASADRTKLMSFNIRHGEGMDGRIDLERIAAVIRRESPDCVGLQEVDVAVGRSGGVDQAARLAELTGLNVAFAKAIDLEKGQHGVAILSRQKPIHTLRYPLPGTEPRMLLVCDFPKFHFATTHLSVGNEGERMASLKIIRERMAELAKGKKVFLCGDWNATPDSSVLKEVGEFARILSPTGVNTCHGPHEPRCLDYIAIDRAHADYITPRVSAVAEERTASDHAPVLIEF